MDINFELYKIFYHAARNLSFSQAASELYITQSAVSQAVKNLEQQLGEQLFARKGRGIRLTPAGELLFTHVEQAYNLLRTGEHKLSQVKNLETGEIRIGVGDTICRYFLIPYLESFTKLHPGIRVRVTNRTSSQILSLLQNGAVDLGIVTLPAVGGDIAVRPFISVSDVFVSSSRYNELRERPVTLEHLSRYPLLMLPQTSATRKLIDSFFNERGITFAPEIELESMELLVEFARIGMGVAYVLRESASSLLDQGELFEVKTLDELPVRKLGFAMLNNVPLSRASSAFLEYVYMRVRNT